MEAPTNSPAGRITFGLYIVLCLAALWPVVFLPFLPTVDLPHHAAVTAMLAHQDRPEFATHYRPDWTASPYLFFYGFTASLAKIVGAAKAVHLFVAATLALYLGCVWTAVRRLQAPAWCALLAFPVLYHSVFFWGFAAFHLSLSLTFLGLVLLLQSRSGFRSTLGLCILALVTSLTHAYGSAFLLLLLTLALLAFRREWRRLLPPITLLLPLTLLWSMLGSLGERQGAESSLTQKISAFFGPFLGYKWQSWKRLLFWGPAGDGVAWVFVGVVVFLLCSALGFAIAKRKEISWKASWATVVEGLRTGFTREGDRHLWARLAISTFFAMNVLGFWLISEHVGQVAHVCLRNGVAALMTLPFLAMAWFPRSGVKVSLLLAGTATALAAASLGVVNVAMVGFASESEGLARVIERLPAGSKVLAIADDRKGDWFSQEVYLQQAYYAQAAKGGFFGFSFAWAFPHIPVKLREEVPHPRLPGDWSHYGLRWFDDEKFGRDYDLLIIHGDVTAAHPKLAPFALESLGNGWHVARRR